VSNLAIDCAAPIGSYSRSSHVSCLLHRSRSLLLAPTHRREPYSRIGQCQKSHGDGDHPAVVSIDLSQTGPTQTVYIRAVENEETRLVLHQGAAPAHVRFRNTAYNVSDEDSCQLLNFTAVLIYR
jgi:hypothetical protein